MVGATQMVCSTVTESVTVSLYVSEDCPPEDLSWTEI